MTEFGNIDKAKTNQDINARIKAVLMLLFQMFNTSRNNTANMIQNFMPHLKRTDRDCGSLPFYGKAYVSPKTNKEHILLTKLSMLVQDYWKVVSGKPEMSAAEALEFVNELELLEQIAKSGFDQYGVTGKLPKFTLMPKSKISLGDAEKARRERAEADRVEAEIQQIQKDADEAKELTDAELGESSSDTSKENTDDTASSREETTSSDELSAEDADACCGDCDNCADQVCTDQKNEGECSLAEEPAGNESGGAADSEPYPDAEPLEQTITDALADEQGGDTIPPMPGEEKGVQTFRLPHEKDDDEGDGQAAVAD